MDQYLPVSHHLKFPFSIGENGPKSSLYQDHIREKIEQVLFTDPGERVFRPEFGAGVRSLVFEPSNVAIASVTQQRLRQSLEDALRGDVDPKQLQIAVSPDPNHDEQLVIEINYTLPAVNLVERLRFEGSSC